MIDALWWIGIVGGIAGTLITLLFKDPNVEQAEELIAELEKESRHV